MTEIPAALRHRPAIHQLCVGAFIQEPLHLSGDVSAFPLQALAFDTEAHYAARYTNEIVGAPVDAPALDSLRAQGTNARPVVALVARLRIDTTPDLMEGIAAPLLSRARSTISWVAGNYLTPISLITATSSSTYFRMTPPGSRQRQRLGFGNTGQEYHGLLNRIMKAAEEDERFAFALSLFQEALREEHPEFRVARFFACLEALAYRLKGGQLKSRQAVRTLLGLEEGATVNMRIDGADCTYDRVELGGRIRDKLFHGVPFEADELTRDARLAYEYLKTRPDLLRDLLLADCEVEIARWANGKSKAQLPPGGDMTRPSTGS